LRAAIGKPITDEQIVATLSRAAQAGMREAKLYFMIGLPGRGRRTLPPSPRWCGGAWRKAAWPG